MVSTGVVLGIPGLKKGMFLSSELFWCCIYWRCQLQPLCTVDNSLIKMYEDLVVWDGQGTASAIVTSSTTNSVELF